MLLCKLGQRGATSAIGSSLNSDDGNRSSWLSQPADFAELLSVSGDRRKQGPYFPAPCFWERSHVAVPVIGRIGRLVLSYPRRNLVVVGGRLW
jgi:hypothetical protein